MEKGFENRLPVTTTYWIEGEIFMIKNTSFMVSQDQGYAIAELMMYAMKDKTTKAVLVDNRDSKGAWPKSLDGLMGQEVNNLEGLTMKKMATLTNSTVTTMQVNRLSRKSGFEKWSKAFNHGYDEEVENFLLG